MRRSRAQARASSMVSRISRRSFSRSFSPRASHAGKKHSPLSRHTLQPPTRFVEILRRLRVAEAREILPIAGRVIERFARHTGHAALLQQMHRAFFAVLPG